MNFTELEELYKEKPEPNFQTANIREVLDIVDKYLNKEIDNEALNKQLLNTGSVYGIQLTDDFETVTRSHQISMGKILRIDMAGGITLKFKV